MWTIHCHFVPIRSMLTLPFKVMTFCLDRQTLESGSREEMLSCLAGKTIRLHCVQDRPTADVNARGRRSTVKIFKNYRQLSRWQRTVFKHYGGKCQSQLLLIYVNCNTACCRLGHVSSSSSRLIEVSRLVRQQHLHASFEN